MLHYRPLAIHSNRKHIRTKRSINLSPSYSQLTMATLEKERGGVGGGTERETESEAGEEHGTTFHLADMKIERLL